VVPPAGCRIDANCHRKIYRKKYFADIKKFSLFLREKKIGEITTHDIEQWVAGLLSKDGEKLDPKTVNRKVSAVINYFLWLTSLQVLPKDPTAPLQCPDPVAASGLPL